MATTIDRRAEPALPIGQRAFRLDVGVRSKVYVSAMDRSAPTPTPMRVSAFAREVGVKPDTIRYYERIGLLRPSARTAANYRYYDQSAVDRVRFIQGSQRLGLRLADIRELLDVRDTGECPCEPAASMIRRRLVEIDGEIDKLHRLRDDLARFAESIPAEDCPEPTPGTWRPREEVSI